MKNYLFLGLIYDRSKEEYYMNRSKDGLQNAVNTFQWNLIDGFADLNCDIDVIHVVPMGTFPRQCDVLSFPRRKWQYRGKNFTECGSINLPILKQIEREQRLYVEVLKWVKKTAGPKQIILYSLYLPFLKVIKRIHKHYPDVFTTVIVADLPSHYGILPQNRIKANIMNAYGKEMLRYSQYCDSFVLLTDAMREPLRVGDRPYVVVEGICPSGAEKFPDPAPIDKKVVFYSGTLHYQYGIRTLMDAFSLIQDQNTELWICGSGVAEDEIEQRAKKDSRIKFFGFCTSEKVSELRSHATVLVNPRTNEGEYTKYSFPSKTMEYMASGIPVVMYKLDGVPEEYTPYLHYVVGDGPEALKNALQGVLEQGEDERLAFGSRAQEFILREKRAKMQVRKILRLDRNRRDNIPAR